MLKDLSNTQQAPPPTGGVKTFERRQRATTKATEGEDAAPMPAQGAPGSPGCNSCSSSPASSSGDGAASAAGLSAALSRRSRRSSVLRGAALPGHQLFSGGTQASRSLLLCRMSKARRKAYMAYTQQMAAHFAEVDQFELLEESPGAATAEKKPRSRLDGRASLPRIQEVPFDAKELELEHAQEAPECSAVAATPASRGHRSSLPLSDLSAASPAVLSAAQLGSSSSSRRSADADTAPAAVAGSTPASIGTGPMGPAAAAAAAPVAFSTDESSLSALPTGARLSLAAETPAVSQAAAGRDAAPLPSCSPERDSLAASTPAPVPPSPPQAGSHDSPCAGSRGVGSAASRAAPAAATTAAAAAHLAGQLQVLSLQGLPQVADQHLQTQQQQLQQEQLASLIMLQAATPAPPYLQQQQQQADTTCAERDAAASSGQAAAAAQPERRPQRQARGKAKQQQQQQQQEPTAAADGDAEAAEVQRQAAEQQRIAQAHFDAWVAQQAELAAVQQLQQLELAASEAQQLSPLQQMLQACGQPVCLDGIPSMQEFLADVADLRDVVKLGEGTYGEAFKAGQVVLKLVPMEGANLINGYPQKGAGDLLGEAVIALALSGLRAHDDEAGAPHASCTDAFVQTHAVGVCRGPYPAPFVRAWRAWDKRNKSENDFIGDLPPEQLYAVFAMANCGRDLEGYVLQGFEQARSMLLQVALALAVAEEALAFEHRDLHWGNVMLSPAHDTHVTARLKGCAIRVRTEGARVRLIDFTASRLQTPRGDVVFCDLEDEDGLFDGPKGKPQFETYRRMRKLTRKDWAGSHPGTNVLWLLYLAELLLSSDKPIPGASAAQKRVLREFKKRLAAGGYGCCSEVLWDELFEGLWSAVDA